MKRKSPTPATLPDFMEAYVPVSLAEQVNKAHIAQKWSLHVLNWQVVIDATFKCSLFAIDEYRHYVAVVFGSVPTSASAIQIITRRASDMHRRPFVVAFQDRNKVTVFDSTGRISYPFHQHALAAVAFASWALLGLECPLHFKLPGVQVEFDGKQIQTQSSADMSPISITLDGASGDRSKLFQHLSSAQAEIKEWPSLTPPRTFWFIVPRKPGSPLGRLGKRADSGEIEFQTFPLGSKLSWPVSSLQEPPSILPVQYIHGEELLQIPPTKIQRLRFSAGRLTRLSSSSSSKAFIPPRQIPIPGSKETATAAAASTTPGPANVDLIQSHILSAFAKKSRIPRKEIIRRLKAKRQPERAIRMAIEELCFVDKSGLVTTMKSLYALKPTHDSQNASAYEAS